MDPLPDIDTSWDFLDYSFIDSSSHLFWPNASVNGDAVFSSGGVALQHNEGIEKECTRKRGHGDSCSRPGTKACREKMRREKLNDSFLELSSVLEPGRPAKTDKPAILDDAIRVLTQLRTEAQELQESNEKLLEEIKSLKAEKNELRDEKLILKSDKEKMEQQLKVMAIPPTGFLPAQPAAYHAGASKMAVYPSYSLIPMWQYMPPSASDTSHDHELRPPAA
ncbi:HLH domain-containing protein [Cephalotus follicularis]|uniref:HLH domain-containing protein n=1 Tax=Cephalotus follicularis TaxID=3775 RepID=A0A1Q3B0N0_CEPFO|nr:HLH domain-containing protein [Cephalotus follicularis]